MEFAHTLHPALQLCCAEQARLFSLKKMREWFKKKISKWDKHDTKVEGLLHRATARHDKGTLDKWFDAWEKSQSRKDGKALRRWEKEYDRIDRHLTKNDL